MRLRELQEQLQLCIQQQVLDTDHPIFRVLDTGEYIDTLAGLSVYTESYQARLKESLTENFPKLKQLMGEENFSIICEAYIKKYPPQHFSIYLFGDHMPEFLQRHVDYKNRIDLIEMAKFERAIDYALIAPDAPTLNLETLSQLSAEAWSTVCFRLHPAVNSLTLYSNIPQVWMALQHNQPMPAVTLLPKASDWMMWRQETEAHFDKLSTPQLWIYKAMREKHNFSAICAGICEWYSDDEAGEQVAMILHTWLKRGCLAT